MDILIDCYWMGHHHRRSQNTGRKQHVPARRNASLDIQDINGNLLGMISTEIAEFKSSLVLSSKFCALVEPTHGWPVFAVLPCRDFAYIVRCDEQEFLSRLGLVTK